ncbi:hypothetical protein COCMIDRAFT_30891 [Bipolaris oryzae ATCC 44560]|uniref:C2H2-type domain-containing protein n=1 Tax=Bipolaris oryzae ATCC 44560 TaxID=930090 RepID=W6YLN5_COCMI|nr:uncharacterized protein COCMIDRAFT_30891 [Bipolaris oryzae ATCC 44560]EUC40122.1 hypothetical protein COCMIDRAFT_30891 [Bipolaris oryzae ATCC 44560]
MFLYARLVCDNLELQSDLDDVKAEVDNLPSGLNEAYGRVLSRIEKDLPPQAKLEAKQILEWVSCSLDLITKSEIQFALMIARGKDPSRGSRRLFMDIFQRCGPIIEEINGYIRFVHFSAREFLLHVQSGPYLTEAKAHADISSTCIDLLLSHCFNEELPDESVREYIKAGSLLLENYVCRRWFDHIMKCVESAPEITHRNIESLLDKRRNDGFGSSSNTISAGKRFNGFAGFPKELHTDLMNLDSFWRSRRRNFCFRKIQNWENLDPFTISKHQARIRRIFEQMLCSGSNHVANCGFAKLQALYGPHIYGCSRPGCARFRDGFKNSEEKDNHIQAHDRQFKCDFIDCPYYDLGFTSTSLLQNHINQFHKSGLHNSASNSNFFVEAKAIVEDAINLDDLNLVRDMHASVRKHGAYFIKTCLMRGSSEDMLRLILKICQCSCLQTPQPTSGQLSGSTANQQTPQPVNRKRGICKQHQIVLLRSWNLNWRQEKPKGDPELFRILLERYMIKVGNFEDIANTPSPEMFELFAEYGAEVGNYQTLFRRLLPTRPNALAEINALKCMQAMANALDIRGYETCLVVLSDSSCSVSIATFCLENGASVEASLAQNRGPTSPLRRAEWKKTPEAAQLAELLRSHHALP